MIRIQKYNKFILNDKLFSAAHNLAIDSEAQLYSDRFRQQRSSKIKYSKQLLQKLELEAQVFEQMLIASLKLHFLLETLYIVICDFFIASFFSLWVYNDYYQFSYSKFHIVFLNYKNFLLKNQLNAILYLFFRKFYHTN